MDEVVSIVGGIGSALKPVLQWFSSNPDEASGLGYGVVHAVFLLAVAVGLVVGVVFMWWGVRKVVQMVMSAFRSGRISL